jgi:hypothetical protein
MKPIVLAILGGAALLYLISCQDPQPNEDVTNAVNKSGAIESSVKVLVTQFGLTIVFLKILSTEIPYQVWAYIILMQKIRMAIQKLFL